MSGKEQNTPQTVMLNKVKHPGQQIHPYCHAELVSASLYQIPKQVRDDIGLVRDDSLYRGGRKE